MATKTISITEEAYERLRARKEPRESFTDAIIKLTGGDPLSELAGILSKEKVDRIEKAIGESRRRSRERMKRMIGELRT